MVTRSEKIKAGIFFLAGAVILVGFLALLGFLQGGRAGYRYTSFFESVRSLQEGAAVKFNGVQVGKVTSIKIAESDPGKVRVDYLVEEPHDRHITRDTIAQLVYVNPLSGQQCISLSPAQKALHGKTAQLPAGETIPTRPSDVAATVEAIQKSLNNMNSLLSENRQYVGDLLKNTDQVMRSVRYLVGKPPEDGQKRAGLIELTNRLSELVPRLKEISDRTKQTMQQAQKSFEKIKDVSTDIEQVVAENRDEVATAVSNFSETSAAIRKAVSEGQPKVSSTVTNLEQVSRDVKSLVADLRGSWPEGRVKTDVRNLSGTLSQMEDLTEQARHLARSLNKTSSTLNSVMAGNRDTVQSSLNDLARAAENLRELTAMLKARPSALLTGSPPEKREIE